MQKYMSIQCLYVAVTKKIVQSTLNYPFKIITIINVPLNIFQLMKIVF